MLINVKPTASFPSILPSSTTNRPSMNLPSGRSKTSEPMVMFNAESGISEPLSDLKTAVIDSNSNSDVS